MTRDRARRAGPASHALGRIVDELADATRFLEGAEPPQRGAVPDVLSFPPAWAERIPPPEKLSGPGDFFGRAEAVELAELVTSDEAAELLAGLGPLVVDGIDLAPGFATLQHLLVTSPDSRLAAET